ncbi:MAG: UDP-N-acetylglucosamine 2-epimerase (hydrolyzing) [Asgard group archaeon]|nr:UDP-N-acetylglucosamine 2-epimerase (hydrolyzing) [Asgard group archaeon]
MKNSRKKIAFLTGTRADFGKLKPLINKVEESDQFQCFIFVTGIHTLSKYGSTYIEVQKQNYENVFIFMNQSQTTDMDVVLANTIVGFSNFVKEIEPDLIIVHGDRVETLAGSIVGSFNNILVSHIEGGELSGTIDELIRHAVSKLAHIHLVANEEAKKRLLQMGEPKEHIFVIGSPDIDIMKSDDLPTIVEAKKRYDIEFDNYAIMIYHPVTTEVDNLDKDIQQVVDALIESKRNFVTIYPNNDHGTEIILNEYQRFENNKHFRVFPSLRFEHFLTLLKNADFIIGNSSAGIREAEIYGIPTVDIGSRQKNRTKSKNIINVPNSKDKILKAITKAEKTTIEPVSYFGDGKSTENFFQILLQGDIWKIKVQKQFLDIL